MKSVLVTGGAGFIGSNIVAELLKKEYRVRVIDNLSTGSLENLREHFENKNFEFIEGDICDYDKCLELMKDIDIVNHQAAMGSVPKSIEDPKPTCMNNVNGFVNILHAAKESGIKRFVYASSSAVYGDNEDMPKEECRVGNPISPYGVTKASDEMYASVYSRLHGIECIGLRYFNVFGEKQSFDNPYAAVIPRFVYNILMGRRSTIYGDGLNSRDFTYVANAVQANVLAIETDNPIALNKAYNVACGQSTTIEQLYGKISEILTSNITPIYTEPRKGDIEHSLADITRASDLLGYFPEYDINSGLERAVQYYIKEVNRKIINEKNGESELFV